MAERSTASSSGAAASDLEAECRRHLDFVRRNCPGMLPDGPTEPGTPIDPIPVDAERATALVRAAIRQAVSGQAGQRPTDPAPDAVVWIDGADSLLVLLDSVTVRTADGWVTVGVDVACDQVRSPAGDRSVHVDIDLVVGTQKRPTGLLAAATTPRGPSAIVDRWHDALVALAWQALLDTAAALSAAAGSDLDGTPLVPTRWTASSAGLTVGPQARHRFDRSPATSRRSSTAQ
jgi:hypothetical protein